MNDEHDDKLIATARQLSTEISPATDLWPGIAQAIAAPQRSRWTPMLAQAAAVVLLIGMSSGLTYIAVKDQPQIIEAPRTDLVFEQAAFGGRYTLGLEYQEAHGNLAAQLDQELGRLSPESREEVEKNLEMIRSAIAQINKALKEEPDNALLQGLLLKTYREELAMMQRVGGLTQHVMSRKDI
ncbi:MAG: hypothetical protein OER22_12825 [Gammaproteobacteria bacterium]|nr:hypothetical protein [Gammaproteobacteria bacterium]MDH3375007.1 hypothetical protein [Gammaproteobacteria bacterium]MDH3409315.1 hypothetical protein [Gammaproteobacteria bacterium]MDH3553494.1 hypothetical protein [Gammaproteobacteria bacterium]